MSLHFFQTWISEIDYIVLYKLKLRFLVTCEARPHKGLAEDGLLVTCLSPGQWGRLAFSLAGRLFSPCKGLRRDTDFHTSTGSMWILPDYSQNIAYSFVWFYKVANTSGKHNSNSTATF